MAQFEWAIIELMVLAILIWQLISVRRLIRRDREAARRAKADPD